MWTLHKIKSELYALETKENSLGGPLFIFKFKLICKNTFQTPHQDHSVFPLFARNLEVIFCSPLKAQHSNAPNSLFTTSKPTRSFCYGNFHPHPYLTDKNELQHIRNSTACPQPSPWSHNLRNLYRHHVIKLIRFQDLLLLAHLYFDNEAPSHPSDLCQTSTPLMPTFCLCHPGSSAWSWGGRALFAAPTSIWNTVPKPRFSESTSFKLARKCIYLNVHLKIHI